MSLEAARPLEQHCQIGPNRRPKLVPLAALLLLLLAVLASARIATHALRMTNLDLPQTAFQGDTIELGCAFTLDSGARAAAVEPRAPRASARGGALFASSSTLAPSSPVGWRGARRATSDDDDDEDGNGNGNGTIVQLQGEQPPELLYAVKWYKDEREFFRFLAQDWPHKQALPMEGVQVDVDKSDNQTVTLRNISLKTSGSYRCEVSTDAPGFVTKSMERKMLVYTLPNEGPSIESLRPKPTKTTQADRHFWGDQVELRCVSRDSKPVAQLDWILNDKLNLSSINIATLAPGAPDPKSLFFVQYRRHVRVPKSSVTTAAAAAAVQHKLPMRSAEATASQRSLFQADINLSADSASSRNLATKSLDQLAEFSTSTLTFAISSDLVRLLHEKSGTAATSVAQRSTAKLKTQRHEPKNATLFVRRSLGGSKWRRGGRQSMSANQTRILLKINCVARVMHLSMSDEIKLRLINETRLAAAQESDTVGEPLGRRQSENNHSSSCIMFSLKMAMFVAMINITVILVSGGTDYVFALKLIH